MEHDGSFTQEEINAAIKLVVDSGGIDQALDYLKLVAQEHNISI